MTLWEAVYILSKELVSYNRHTTWLSSIFLFISSMKYTYPPNQTDTFCFQTQFRYLLTCLAINDFTVGLLVTACAIVPALLQCWPFGQTVCQIQVSTRTNSFRFIGFVSKGISCKSPGTQLELVNEGTTNNSCHSTLLDKKL